MNSVTILLTTLMGLFSIAGAVPDQVIEQSIRDQLADAETLVVRADATPNTQLLQGKLDQLRIAGRGLYPYSGVRIDTLDIETDAIDLDVDALRNGQIAFEQPLQAAMNLVLTQNDINQALRSPLVVNQLEALSVNLLGTTVGQLNQASLENPQITLLEDNRIQVSATLVQDNTQERLVVSLTTGLAIQSGTQLQLIDPQLITNDVEFPPSLMNQFAESFSQE
ncbi:MAG: DUF2993 domain-containing protein, partial [Merismopedia sp. SIO2A8]|nr:DUF2993 domain-containing protein [Merismopedia sp. SIO2A8]